MKNVFMVLAIGALVLGSILTVGIMMEENKPQPNVVYYNVPAPVPTQTQFEKVNPPATDSATGYATFNLDIKR